MKKTLLSVLFVAFGVCAANAATYFFSPNGAGEADGTSWENAAAGSDLGDFLSSSVEEGDIICLQEGKYAPSASTNRWFIPQGITIKGGYPLSMTGTNTEYDLAKGGQSVFSADLDGDGVGNNLDYAFVYIGAGDPTEKSTAYYKDWKLTEIWGITFRDGYRKESKYWGNMVFVQAAQVDFHFCQFLNNNSWRADRNAGGSNGAIEIWGSAVRVFDCIFKDNTTAAGSGAAFQVRARQSNSAATDPADYSIAYFERCEFDNNIAYCTGTSTESDKSWGTYGGNCSVADNGGTLYMINCTIAHSKAWYRGVGIRLGGKTTGYFINTTWMDNPCLSRSSRGSNNGSALSLGTDAVVYLANNIMVEKAAYDDFTSTDPVICIQAAGNKTISAGYNVLGTIQDNAGDNTKFVSTDNIPTSLQTLNTVETVFGTNDFENKGGVSRVIAPTMDVKGMAIADMKTAIAQWPIDEMAKVMDLDKDQRGYTRAAVTMSGAYDAEATAPAETGLQNLKLNGVKASKVIVDGQLYIIRNGVYYNALGAQM